MNVAPMSEEVYFGSYWGQSKRQNLNKYDFNGIISRKCSNQPQIDIRLR